LVLKSIILIATIQLLENRGNTRAQIILPLNMPSIYYRGNSTKIELSILGLNTTEEKTKGVLENFRTNVNLE
jgi:hypothetical protein